MHPLNATRHAAVTIVRGLLALRLYPRSLASGRRDLGAHERGPDLEDPWRAAVRPDGDELVVRRLGP